MMGTSGGRVLTTSTFIAQSCEECASNLQSGTSTPAWQQIVVSQTGLWSFQGHPHTHRERPCSWENRRYECTGKGVSNGFWSQFDLREAGSVCVCVGKSLPFQGLFGTQVTPLGMRVF